MKGGYWNSQLHPSLGCSINRQYFLFVRFQCIRSNFLDLSCQCYTVNGHLFLKLYSKYFKQFSSVLFRAETFCLFYTLLILFEFSIYTYIWSYGIFFDVYMQYCLRSHFPLLYFENTVFLHFHPRVCFGKQYLPFQSILIRTKTRTLPVIILHHFVYFLYILQIFCKTQYMSSFLLTVYFEQTKFFFQSILISIMTRTPTSVVLYCGSLLLDMSIIFFSKHCISTYTLASFFFPLNKD